MQNKPFAAIEHLPAAAVPTYRAIEHDGFDMTAKFGELRCGEDVINSLRRPLDDRPLVQIGDNVMRRCAELLK